MILLTTSKRRQVDLRSRFSREQAGYVAAFGGIIGVEGSVELVRADLVGGFSGARSTYLFIYLISVNKW